MQKFFFLKSTAIYDLRFSGKHNLSEKGLGVQKFSQNFGMEYCTYCNIQTISVI